MHGVIIPPWYMCVYVSVCVCVCVCVCLCVRASTSIHCEGFICLEQLECQGTDQWCCVEDVSFLHKVPSLLLSLFNYPLYPVHTLEAGKAATWCVCRFRNMRPWFTTIRHRPRSALQLKPTYIWRQTLTRGVVIQLWKTKVTTNLSIESGLWQST